MSQTIDSSGARLLCPVLKLPSEEACSSAHTRYADPKRAGWYYCENDTSKENTEYTCSDGIDNDSDGNTDCDETRCRDCAICGAEDSACTLGCAYEIALTDLAMEVARSKRLLLECPIYN